MRRSAAVFGSAITSTRQNGAAVFFRGLCRALARAGLQTLFAEEDWELREVESDGLPAEIAVRRYASTEDVRRILAAAPSPRLVLKFVECGSMDEAIEETILACRQEGDRALFVDGDAPSTLEKIGRSLTHYLRSILPRFDGLLVLAGGEEAAARYQSLGVGHVEWGYCAVDEQFWRPVPPTPKLQGNLLFAGNRLADREERFQEFFVRPASLLPDFRFLLAGSGWENANLPSNVRCLGHLSPYELRQAYCSANLVLNINRAPMARYGYSPASRLFEAASCGACMVSDRWPGIEEILVPESEIILADDGRDVASALKAYEPATREETGEASQERVRRDYTCDRWVKDLLLRLVQWKSVAAGVSGAGKAE